jgi:hypothetical protein
MDRHPAGKEQDVSGTYSLKRNNDTSELTKYRPFKVREANK